jgi:hypoxanthine phosphoribosyltransferase
MRLLLSEEAISEKIHYVAQDLDAYYTGRTLTLVVVLKGALFLAVDLTRALKIAVELEFVRAQSYGSLGTSAGPLTISGVEELNLTGKDILLVDDIFDTGATLSALSQDIQKKRPRSLRTLCLLRKKNAPLVRSPDYCLFEIEDYFVVGYGLDYKEAYRALKGIYLLESDR